VSMSTPMARWCGQKRGNRTHRLTTDPDCRFVSEDRWGTGAYPGYTVDALMENRNRIPLGVAGRDLPGQQRVGTRGVESTRPRQTTLAVQAQEPGDRQGILP
jgi:hypothetical protein